MAGYVFWVTQRLGNTISVVQLYPTLYDSMDYSTQASLSFTISQSLLKLMSIESVIPCNHLILSRPLLLLPSIFPSIRIFSNESALWIRWPKCWSFSFGTSSSNEYSGLISFRIDWVDLLLSKGLIIITGIGRNRWKETRSWPFLDTPSPHSISHCFPPGMWISSETRGSICWYFLPGTHPPVIWHLPFSLITSPPNLHIWDLLALLLLLATFSFLATKHRLWDFSALTRDWTCALSSESGEF